MSTIPEMEDEVTETVNDSEPGSVLHPHIKDPVCAEKAGVVSEHGTAGVNETVTLNLEILPGGAKYLGPGCENGYHGTEEHT